MFNLLQNIPKKVLDTEKGINKVEDHQDIYFDPNEFHHKDPMTMKDGLVVKTGSTMTRDHSNIYDDLTGVHTTGEMTVKKGSPSKMKNKKQHSLS